MYATKKRRKQVTEHNKKHKKPAKIKEKNYIDVEKRRSINNRMIPQNGKSSNIDLEVKECNLIERVKVKKVHHINISALIIKL